MTPGKSCCHSSVHFLCLSLGWTQTRPQGASKAREKRPGDEVGMDTLRYRPCYGQIPTSDKALMNWQQATLRIATKKWPTFQNMKQLYLIFRLGTYIPLFLPLPSPPPPPKRASRKDGMNIQIELNELGAFGYLPKIH